MVGAFAGCSSDGGGAARECAQGEVRCSADALGVEVCTAGRWELGDFCMAEHGQLCEVGGCVDPWRFGSPRYESCAGDPHATAASLAAKAAHYDRQGEVLHVHPGDGRVHDVHIRAGVSEVTATYADVVDWDNSENDGLWTGLYIASQAFRYAVTRDDAVLAHLRVLVDGLVRGMRITGVEGIFTREYIPPGIAGMECPDDPLAFVPDVEKDDNAWVKVDADGTVMVVDPASGAFRRTDHRVPAEYAGYCWLDNVSKDEYAGHMMALGALWKLVDDPAIRETTGSLLEQIADHLMRHDMAFVDWDGRITEHGRFWPTAIDDWPDFNAVLGLNHVKLGTVASGREDLRAFYDDCLLQKSGKRDCLGRFLANAVPYTDWLSFTGLYFGQKSCKANWNNFGMEFSAIFTLIWFEQDPALRARLQEFLETKAYRNQVEIREMARQQNAAWSFVAASMKRMGPGSSGPDYDAVRAGVCALAQFPESKASPELHVGEAEFPTDLSCESRFDGRFLTFDPVPVYQRCLGVFTWWSNPYAHQNCTADPTDIDNPGDYLLPYWMGRYFGFIDPSW